MLTEANLSKRSKRVIEAALVAAAVAFADEAARWTWRRVKRVIKEIRRGA